MTFHKCSIASPGFPMGKGIQRLSRLPASHDHLCNCVTVGGLRSDVPALCAFRMVVRPWCDLQGSLPVRLRPTTVIARWRC